MEPNEDPPFQPENVDPGQQPQPEAPVEGGAPQPPPKRASKTSAQAQERQKERRQAAKSVKIDISDEVWQEVVDWLLRRRQETSRKNRYVSAAEYFLKRWELLPPGANVERQWSLGEPLNVKQPLKIFHVHPHRRVRYM